MQEDNISGQTDRPRFARELIPAFDSTQSIYQPCSVRQSSPTFAHYRRSTTIVSLDASTSTLSRDNSGREVNAAPFKRNHALVRHAETGKPRPRGAARHAHPTELRPDVPLPNPHHCIHREL